MKARYLGGGIGLAFVVLLLSFGSASADKWFVLSEKVIESMNPSVDIKAEEGKMWKEDIKKNADGSIDVYFGPKAPVGRESNWVQTVPGKGWFAYFRFYGPTEPFFNKSWVLPDFEKVN